jgi:Family of unknown function (DUF6599)
MRIRFVLPLVLLFASTAAAQEYLNCRLVPGWEQSGTKREYTADNLYEYMDGNAESYLLYGFVRMQGISCMSGDKKLVIDVSEMEDSDLAYGMFASNRDPNQAVANIAMGGQVQPRRASFAKGKYYVEIAASPEGDHTAALQAFATKMEASVEGRSTPPEALEWFPKEGLASLRLVPESVLGLRQLKRGFVAKYAQGQAIIVLEASPEAAVEVFKKVQARFPDASSAKVGDEAFQAKTQYLAGICIFRKGRYVAGSANLPDAQEAVTQAIKLAARIP